MPKRKSKKKFYQVRRNGLFNERTRKIIPTQKLFNDKGVLKRQYQKIFNQFGVKQLSKTLNLFGEDFLRDKIFVNFNKNKKTISDWVIQNNKVVKAKKLIQNKDFKNRVYHQNELIDKTKSTNLYNSVLEEYKNDLKLFNESVLQEVEFDLTKINLNQILDLIRKELKLELGPDEGRPIIQIGNIYRPLNNKVFNDLYKNFSMTDTAYKDSYQEAVLNARMIRYVYLMYPSRERERKEDVGDFFGLEEKKQRPIYITDFFIPKQKGGFHQYNSGGFFKYYNMTELDLTRYAIYTEEIVNDPLYVDEHFKSLYSENCLYKALYFGGLNKEKLKKLRQCIKTRDITANKLTSICKDLEICIKLSKLQNYSPDDHERMYMRTIYYGDKTNEIFNIGLIDSHYFLVEDTNITSFYIKNYDKLKNEIDGHRITRMREGKTKTTYTRLPVGKKGINSFNLVKQLLINQEETLKVMKLNERLCKTQFYDVVDDFDDLEYTDDSVREIINKRQKIEELKNEIKEEKRYNKKNKLINKLKRLTQKKEYKHATKMNKTEINMLITKIEQQPKYFNDLVGKITRQKLRNMIIQQHREATIRMNDVHKLKKIAINKKLDINERRRASNIFYEILQDFNEKSITKRIYFDVETYTNKNGLHRPYLCCYLIEGEKEVKSYVGADCIYQMVNNFPSCNIVAIAHNCYYDYSFVLESLTSVYSPIFKGNSLITSSGIHFKNGRSYKLEFKDSSRMITLSLKKFGETFGLDQKKEVMPYNLYNVRNPLENRLVSVNEFCSYLEKDEIRQALLNIKKWDCLIGNQVDIIEYSKKYCEMDCIVLAEGYLKFKGWMEEITNNSIDIDEQYTISGLAYNYIKEIGCLEGCYQISNIPRRFIQKCVVGGRCMTSENKKHYIKGKKISDTDANALYPSSIYRIPGFLLGKPKVLTDKSMEFLNTTDMYYVKVKILSLGKKRKFPLLSYKNDEGVRVFTNDIIGKEIYIDKIALEDAVKYQDVKVEILQGYYFNDGFNPKIVDVIYELYYERLKKKAEGNKIQNCYKMLQNSIYGKMLLKEIDVDLEVIQRSKIAQYLAKYYNFIKTIKPVGDFYFVERYKQINTHFNSVHLGVHILSMSKRIMNEVMCLAEDNNIDIYYQDTDSMHLDSDKLEELEELYRKEFKRELCGKDMGQFSSDFKLKGAITDTVQSTKAIFLGKKAYIDQLEGVNDKGDNVLGYHYRCKGVVNESIPYECELRQNYFNVVNQIKGAKQERFTEFNLYELKYYGLGINYDLLCGGKKAKFEYRKEVDGFNVYSRNEFTRYIKF